MDNGKTNRNSATKEFGVGRGAYGCKWVRMGAIGYVGAGGQENKVRMRIYWYTGHGFGPYGRGNFPGHDVLRISPKMFKS